MAKHTRLSISKHLLRTIGVVLFASSLAFAQVVKPADTIAPPIPGVDHDAPSLSAQNSSNVERSPEAITLIQRVLDASGGEASVAAIQDLIAIGTLSAPMNAKETAETAVTLSMRGSDQLRIDSTLPKGVRSIFYNRGGLSSKEEDGAVVPLGSEDALRSTSRFFPLEHLVAALHDSSYSVTVPGAGADQESGDNLHRLRVQRIRTETVGSAHRTTSSVALDYYVDATTNRIVRIQILHADRGVTPVDRKRGPFDIYHFSDYRLDNGLLLPHQISVSIDSRLISTIHISTYQFNTGLAEGNFAPTLEQ